MQIYDSWRWNEWTLFLGFMYGRAGVRVRVCLHVRKRVGRMRTVQHCASGLHALGNMMRTIGFVLRTALSFLFFLLFAVYSGVVKND